MTTLVWRRRGRAAMRVEWDSPFARGRARARSSCKRHDVAVLERVCSSGVPSLPAFSLSLAGSHLLLRPLCGAAPRSAAL